MDALAPLPVIFTIDLLRYSITASLAFLIFWVWRKDRWEHRRIQTRRPSAKTMRREVLYSLSTVAIFTAVGFAVFHLHLISTVDRGFIWWLASIALAIVLHDTYFYWMHRALHTKLLFARVHRIHHLSTSPSPWAAYAFSPLEALAEAAIVPLVLVILPMQDSALFVFLLYMIAMNVLGHLGIELYPPGFPRGPWTRWLSTTTHHDMHHRDARGNYGLYFTWWDRLMGTQASDYAETYDRVVSRPRAVR